MLKQLRAANFKSWKDTGSLHLAPLTGLFGTNSSGKTSILQLLLMLKQTTESPDRKRVFHTGDQRSLVDLGTFFDLIHGHRESEKLILALKWDFENPLIINDPENRDKQLYDVKKLSFVTVIRNDNGRPVVREFQYGVGDDKFGMRRKNGEQEQERDRYDLIHEGYNAKRVQGRAWPLPAPVKCYGFPDEAIGYYQNTGFLPDLVLAFEALFAGISYLGPLREYPQRSYVWAGESPLDVGRRGDLAVPALLASRGRKTISRGRGRGKSKQTVEERVAAWLREMGLIDSFSLRPVAQNRKDYEVRVKKSAASPEVLITDVGFGVSQILPVLVLCYYVPEGSIILLEQPEIHLHPSVQAAMADVLIDAVTRRGVQIIVESHSEHLLRRLQRRVAENEINTEEIALYFCRMEDSESKLERLEMDLFGNIANWPPGFFGDELGELIAMTEASIDKR